MSLRTPLAKVRGLGSARQGTHHWWYQRVTAIALTPLSLWLILALASLPALDYATITAWIATPLTAVLLVLLLPCLFYHAQLGIQVVIEDYIDSEWQKISCIVIVKFLASLATVIAIMAIIKIYIGAQV